MVTANKVTQWNTVLHMEQTEICDNERLAQLRGFPFMIDTVTTFVEIDDEVADKTINGIGGVTPAFRKMMQKEFKEPKPSYHHVVGGEWY